ncbi:magnesium transporter CorA family protein [Legionella sp. CNM-4043-24]|uniref:magnesium transporter CorA family protein n=1 Tax=Legionella sp. CNM-4043-24 TaxID=3421646 RepID=UPI00403AB5D9
MVITAYLLSNNLNPVMIHEHNAGLLNEAIWIDLLSPDKKEKDLVETALSLNIPSQEEMREIELSSRLYALDDSLFMTATMVAQSDSENPNYDAVTFVLTPAQLITIRYIEPQSFKQFIANLLKINNKSALQAIHVFILLLDAAVDRLADVLEYAGHHLDKYSQTVFRYGGNVDTKKRPDYEALMLEIGIKSNLNTKARESLVAFSRLVTFFRQSTEARLDKEWQSRILTLCSDLSSLSDYASFISNKINFLLDATLGMINIEQSAIIKIFSVAAVIFLPPTLIASVYGMNFKFMSFLSFRWGYETAIGMMFLSAWVPYRFFKYKRWL